MSWASWFLPGLEETTARKGAWLGVCLILFCRDFLELFWGKLLPQTGRARNALPVGWEMLGTQESSTIRLCDSDCL